jgi:hypothetical protein
VHKVRRRTLECTTGIGEPASLDQRVDENILSNRDERLHALFVNQLKHLCRKARFVSSMRQCDGPDLLISHVAHIPPRHQSPEASACDQGQRTEDDSWSSRLSLRLYVEIACA